MPRRTLHHFLLDNNVPNSVGEYLRDRGHDVVSIREIDVHDASDHVVAVTAIASRRILVTWDKDFNQQKYDPPRYSELMVIGFSLPALMAAERLKSVVSLTEWILKNPIGGKPIRMRIGRDRIRIVN